MSRQTIDPVFRAAVRTELESLPLKRRPRRVSSTRSVRGARAARLQVGVVTAAVAVVVTLGSVALINAHLLGGARAGSNPSAQVIATLSSDTATQQTIDLDTAGRPLRVILVCSGGGTTQILTSPEMGSLSSTCGDGSPERGSVGLLPDRGIVRVRVSASSRSTKWTITVIDATGEPTSRPSSAASH